MSVNSEVSRARSALSNLNNTWHHFVYATSSYLPLHCVVLHLGDLVWHGTKLVTWYGMGPTWSLGMAWDQLGHLVWNGTIQPDITYITSYYYYFHSCHLVHICCEHTCSTHDLYFWQHTKTCCCEQQLVDSFLEFASARKKTRMSQTEIWTGPRRAEN